MMHLVDCLHKCAHTGQLWTLVSDLLSSVEHGVEFAYFIGVTDPVEDDLELILASWHLEIVLSNTHLSEG
jgi:hypothetical protein